MRTTLRAEAPDTDACPPLHLAVARAMRKSALMVFPPTVSRRSATEASALDWLPCPTVAACSASTDSTPGTLAVSSVASWAPPEEGRSPVSARVMGVRAEVRSAYPEVEAHGGRWVDADALADWPGRESGGLKQYA